MTKFLSSLRNDLACSLEGDLDGVSCFSVLDTDENGTLEEGDVPQGVAEVDIRIFYLSLVLYEIAWDGGEIVGVLRQLAWLKVGFSGWLSGIRSLTIGDLDRKGYHQHYQGQ